MTLVVLDLFAGTGSSTQAFADRGHKVVRVELDPQHEAELHADVSRLLTTQVFDLCGGEPDFIWASPPCTCFSVASIGHYWERGETSVRPKHPDALAAQELVLATLELIRNLVPHFWLMENPRGMLRKMPFMAQYPRTTVTYCQYGDTRMKPTDLWGRMPWGWRPRPACKNGAPCHTPAPRGSRTGTQGIVGSVDRSRVPYELSLEICTQIEAALCLT